MAGVVGTDGGAPSVAYLLSDLGGGTGHHLFSLLRARPGGSWTARVLSEAGNTARVDCPVPLDLLPATRFSRYPLAQIERYRQLRSRLSEERPDVLHTYFFWSIIYGRLLRARGAVARLVENREDLGFNWGLHEYTLLRLTRNIPDRVVCVSEAVRERVLDRERLDPSRAVVIHNGIAPPTARDEAASATIRDELGIPVTAPLVGMVANFNRPVKGAVYFVEALPLVARAIPDVRFVLIGLGENQAALRQRAEAAGVGDRLIFTGFRSDIDRLYDTMDVSALTSLSEGLSITLLESMRHGVPVVATNVGGNPEVVRHGETGFLVPARDPERFAAEVVKLLRDADLRARFGHRAREVVRESFSLEDVAADYGDLYDQLSARPSARASRVRDRPAS
jgi:glycosyltransferase involved in cell wall biosynthesis